jgi:HD-GYP domain-containing protein (c-di-GMP phosphodiesterase class II)
MTLWFIVLVVSGAGCAALGLFAVVRGVRTGAAELAIIGTTFSVAALGMTVHGLIGIVDESAIGDVGLRLALPFGLFAAVPVLAPRTRATLQVLRRWRAWTLGALCLGTVITMIDVFVPGTMLPARVATFLQILTGAGVLVLAHRQLYLHRIGRQPSSLLAAVAILLFGAAGIAALRATPASAFGWAFVGLDAAAFLVAVTAIVVTLRSGSDMHSVLSAVVAHEPLALFEVGLAPECRAFVSALGTKDSATRNHVIRSSALALRVGMRAGLDDRTVRDVGLAALLHDVGKLVVPDEILQRPSGLDPASFAVMQRHPDNGADMLERIPSLATVAPLVRQHHERHDGTGYPAGLRSEQILPGAAIVSVCDAWDAMVEDRPYRRGMDPGVAARILRDGAGTQWSPEAVEMLLREVSVVPRADLAGIDITGIDMADPATDSCSAVEHGSGPVAVPAR